MQQILADAEAMTVVIERVRTDTTHVARHSLEDVMTARALIADQQAAKEQTR